MYSAPTQLHQLIQLARPVLVDLASSESSQKPSDVLGTGEWRWGKREIIYLLRHCLHHNDSCIKMGSYERHFSVSLIVRDEVTRRCPQTTTFLKRRESRSGIEPRPFCLPA